MREKSYVKNADQGERETVLTVYERGRKTISGMLKKKSIARNQNEGECNGDML